MRAVLAGEQVRVRNPGSVRPWQHVLNPLSGYLVLAQALWNSPEHATGWNFGRLTTTLAVSAGSWDASPSSGPGSCVGASRWPPSARGALPEARLLTRAGTSGLASPCRARGGAGGDGGVVSAAQRGRRHARCDARADRRAGLSHYSRVTRTLLSQASLTGQRALTYPESTRTPCHDLPRTGWLPSRLHGQWGASPELVEEGRLDGIDPPRAKARWWGKSVVLLVELHIVSLVVPAAHCLRNTACRDFAASSSK